MSSNFRAERAFKMPSLHQAPLLHRGDLIANLLSAKLPSAADNGLFKVKADRQHCFPFTSDFSSPAKLLDPSLNSTLSVTTANSSFRADSATKANNAELVSIQSLLQAVDFLVPEHKSSKIEVLGVSKLHEIKTHTPSLPESSGFAPVRHEQEDNLQDASLKDTREHSVHLHNDSVQVANINGEHVQDDSLVIQEDNFQEDNFDTQCKFDSVFEQAQGLDRPVCALLQQWLQNEHTNLSHDLHDLHNLHELHRDKDQHGFLKHTSLHHKYLHHDLA